MDENHVIFGMIHRVEDLVRGQANVNSVKDSSHHGYGKETLQVTMGIPVQDRDRRTRPHAKRVQRGSEPIDPAVQSPGTRSATGHDTQSLDRARK